MSPSEIAELRQRARRLWELAWDLLSAADGHWTPEVEQAMEVCRQDMQLLLLRMEQELQRRIEEQE